MSWMDRIGDLLKQYTSTDSGAAAAPALDVHTHFDQVARAVPRSTIADGLAAAFRSDQTPAFGELVSTLFGNSNGAQKAGMLNELLSFANPSTLAQVLPALGLAGATGGSVSQLTPEQAQQVSPQAVQQLATHVEKHDPAVIGSLSTFYAQHSALVKTLGSSVLTVALAKIAERRRQG